MRGTHRNWELNRIGEVSTNHFWSKDLYKIKLPCLQERKIEYRNELQPSAIFTLLRPVRLDQKWSHIARQLPYSRRNVAQCALYSYSALFWEKAIVLNFYVFTIMLRFSVTAFIFKLLCNCIDPPSYFEK